jgi:hypothetical protein
VKPPKATGLLQALGIYAASRLILMAAFNFASVRMQQRPAPGLWNITTAWWNCLLRWDAAYYIDIAKYGYGNPWNAHAGAFLPGYPLMIRAVSAVTRLTPEVSSLVVANLCAVCAIGLLYGLVQDLFDSEIAIPTVGLLSFFPASLFLSAAYTEGPALLLTVAFFVALFRERVTLAAACAGMLSAVRPTGCVLAVPLLFYVWRKEGGRLSLRSAMRALGEGVLAVSGLLAYMAYCGVRFHDPLRLVGDQGSWSSKPVPGQLAWSQITAGIRSVIWPDSNDPWVFLAFLFLVAATWKRLPMWLNLYSVTYLAFLAVTRVFRYEGFISMDRYLLLVFPAMIGAALLLRGRTWLTLSAVGGMGAFLFLYAALFAQWYWAG